MKNSELKFSMPSVELTEKSIWYYTLIESEDELQIMIQQIQLQI
jgi:hypothetical protein